MCDNMNKTPENIRLTESTVLTEENNYSFKSEKQVDDTDAPLTNEKDNLALENIIQNNMKEGFKYRPYSPWILTYSGKRFNPTNPVKESIAIEDIAHALSMKCRFGGHVLDFYSIAQHSVLVSYICDFKDSLCGLLHDASEAYLVDLVSPLKYSGKFDEFIQYENKLQGSILERFNLSSDIPHSVHLADGIMLATEAANFMRLSLNREDSIYFGKESPLPIKIIPLEPKEAEKLFLDRFYKLETIHSITYKVYDIDKEFQNG